MIVKCNDCGTKINLQIGPDNSYKTTEDKVLNAEIDYLCPYCNKPCSIAVLIAYTPGGNDGTHKRSYGISV